MVILVNTKSGLGRNIERPLSVEVHLHMQQAIDEPVASPPAISSPLFHCLLLGKSASRRDTTTTTPTFIAACLQVGACQPTKGIVTVSDFRLLYVNRKGVTLAQPWRRRSVRGCPGYVECMLLDHRSTTHAECIR